MDPGAGGYHVSHLIVFRQHQSVTPVLLWLQNAVPPLVAGATLYPLARFFNV